MESSEWRHQLKALHIITDNLIAFGKLSLARGAAGIFLSVPASADIMNRDQFLRFCKPFALKLLSALQEGKERFGGCSIDTWIDPGSIKAIVTAARR